jgi:prepilin-type N-terminal cleavage/methylation domain-containing protein
MKRRTETGFTLLEVLAAVAILGIWFVVLANVAIQGLRAEGENERRIRASLIADRFLTDLELGFDIGELPEETAEEFEEDEFVILVESLPLTGLELAEGVAPPEEGEDLVELLEGDLSALAADLYTIQVTVRWTEGAADKTVRRTTYYWDSSALMEALGQQDEQDEEEEDETEGSEAEASEGDSARAEEND